MSNEDDKDVFECAKGFVVLIKKTGCDHVRVRVDGVEYEVSVMPVEFIKKGILIKSSENKKR